MHTLDTIKRRNEQLNQLMLVIKDENNQAFNEELLRIRQDNARTRYTIATTEQFIEDLTVLAKNNQNKDKLRATLYFTYSTYQAIQDSDLDNTYSVQSRLESIIQTGLDSNFKLFETLSLENIAQQYEDNYANQYGQGAIGFFKLPIKRFFQQATRREELLFLENIEEYCTNSAHLSVDDKKKLRLSAMNLVYRKISTETFGKGSTLAKLLQNKIAAASIDNASFVMIEHLTSECMANSIIMPKHLQDFYNEQVDFAQSPKA